MRKFISFIYCYIFPCPRMFIKSTNLYPSHIGLRKQMKKNQWRKSEGMIGERKEKPHWNEVSECHLTFSLLSSQTSGLFHSSNFHPKEQYLSPNFQLNDKSILKTWAWEGTWLWLPGGTSHELHYITGKQKSGQVPCKSECTLLRSSPEIFAIMQVLACHPFPIAGRTHVLILLHSYLLLLLY